MRRFHCVALGAVALCGLASIASAADMPVKAPAAVATYNWTGWYVGANAGGQWGRDKITTTTDPVGWGGANAATIDAAAPTTLNVNGFIGGLQGGYNWQSNNFLLGVEVDADWAGGSASRLLPGGGFDVGGGNYMTDATKSQFLATVRPRLGLVFDRALLYATGGLAIGTLKTTDTYAPFGGTSVATISSSTTRVGWTVGGGLEYAVTPKWTVKAEYLHVDLGTTNPVIPSCGICGAGMDIPVHHQYTEEIARLGVNYQFH